MGDIRNKLEKIARQKAEKAAVEGWLRARGIDPNPKREPPPVLRCACGNAHYDVPIMWSLPGPDRWAPARFACPACVPPEFLPYAMMDVARHVDREPVPEPEALAGVESPPMLKSTPEITVRVRHEGPHRYVVRRDDRPHDTMLGMGSNMHIAVGSARHEADRIAQTERRDVIIEVEQPNGDFKQEAVCKPRPVHKRGR